MCVYACDKDEGKGGGGRTNVCGGESVRRMRAGGASKWQEERDWLAKTNSGNSELGKRRRSMSGERNEPKSEGKA